MARDWKSLVDQMLDSARDAGTFDNLPGNGKPLQLEDDSHIPSEMKLAHKMLKEHDLTPEWIMQGKDIDALRERLLADMRKGWRLFQGAQADADRSNMPLHNRKRNESTWQRTQETYRTTALRLNREIMTYNLKVPPGFPHKALFDVERELQRLMNLT